MNIAMPAMIARIFHGVEQAIQNRASRRALEGLDDRMLKDLGLSRAQAQFEASRASWNLPPDKA